MKKRLQNKVAESKLALPLASVYATGVWLLCGLIQQQWWAQFVCFGVSTILMAQINNANALIRIYSRMMSCSFLVLTCCACFLFPFAHKGIMEMCIVGSMFMLFMSYQDKQSGGYTYYAYLLFGTASIFYAQVLYYLPLLWLLSATQLQSLSWRTWGASVLGLLTPYWYESCLLVWAGDFTPLINHFARLTTFKAPFDFSILSTSQIATFALVGMTAITGIIHYINKHHDDKIRVRLIFGFFIWTDLATALFLILQPQHYDCLMRIMIICTAPLIAHFLALTSTKMTNIAFCAFIVLTLILTGYNIWMFLSPS